MANEVRLIDPILTSLAQEYRNSKFVANQLFPVVSVSRRKGRIPIFGRQALVHRDTFRAIRSNSNRIPPNEINYLEFEMLERDVEVSLDYIEEEE
ncbi:MAG: inorganic pyrophosphatase, partial [Candidatus Kapaibacteriota bacterium]